MSWITRSCSGCLNSVDGHPDGEYPWDAKAGCYVGAGCHECGYTGKRRWHFDSKEVDQGMIDEAFASEKEFKK